jgi:hypothetical protein
MFKGSAALLILFATACAGSDEATGGGGPDGGGSVADARPGGGGGPDGASGDSCGPETCTGCCSEGTCVEGTSEDACGIGGETCSACQGGQLCGAGTCDLYPDGRYDLVLLDATVDASKVSGASWDVSGGLPDVKLFGWTTYIDDIRSTQKDNTTSPDWMGETIATDANLSAGIATIFVMDDDGIDDDFICQFTDCPMNPPNATLECSVERGTESPSEYDGENAGCTIRYKVVPH